MTLTHTNIIVLSLFSAVISTGCDSLNVNAMPQDTVSPLHEIDTLSKTQVKAVETVSLKPEPYTSTLEVSGKTLALRESYLSLSVPGLIKSIHVKLGDKVVKNQVLLRLDRRGYQLGVRQAAAALDGANAATEQLATEIARVDQLLTEGAAPSAAKDDLIAKDKGAKAQVRAADATLAQANKALKDSVLKAPYDGVIAALLKEEGEQAPAMPPTMLMKIVDVSQLDVQVFVPETSARFIQLGTKAEVTVDNADIVTTGEAVFVSNVIQPSTRTFEVRIRIDNPDERIKAGSFARVRLTEETIADAILIPVSSVLRDKQDQPYVFIANDGKAKQVPIELGPPKGARVLVRKGLDGTQKLISSDAASLKDGQAISVTE